ncbi:putative exodeoxyribonuclease [Vibrio phage RYC]|nr:putative exodeoxyribonuclease [Vibrio phage RYC]
MKFGRKAKQSTQKEPSNRKTFDNKMLKMLQVIDLEDIVTDDLTVVIDSDTIPYRGAAKQDDNYVEVRHIASGQVKEFKNKTEFKGASRKEGVITQKSWLGIENMKRESAGKPPFELEQFEIIPKKRLIADEEQCKKNIREFIDEYISAIKEQTAASQVLCLLGGGDNFRHMLPLPQPYKGNREDVQRPLLLKYAREYLMDNYQHEMLKHDDPMQNREADDRGQQYMWIGYENYRREGKFNYILAALDKDARQSAGLLFDYNRQGENWINCNPWLIEGTDVSVGELEYTEKGECKATGLKMVAYQLICGDSADHYHLYLRFPKEMHRSPAYSDAAFFRDFHALSTAKGVLEKVVEVVFETFPKGLQFTDHMGNEQDMDTMTWLECLFTCVYMLHKEKDDTTLSLIMDKHAVNYDCLVGNNAPEAPKQLSEAPVLIEAYDDLQKALAEVDALLSKKTGKKDDLLERMQVSRTMLEQAWVDLSNKMFVEDLSDKEEE